METILRSQPPTKAAAPALAPNPRRHAATREAACHANPQCMHAKNAEALGRALWLGSQDLGGIVKLYGGLNSMNQVKTCLKVVRT